MIGSALDWLRDKRREPGDAATGRRGEDLAHRFLRKQGFTIVARNYRLSSGDAEADLIARDQDDLVIVEVKTRESSQYGPPDRAVGLEKQRHLVRIARDYTRKTGIAWERVRFDVVGVVLSDPPQIEHFQNAFGLR